MNLQRCFFLGALAALTVLTQAGLQAAPDPKEMLEQMDLILRGKSHQMTVKMDIQTKSWKRNYKLKVWMNGIDKTMARVLEPSKVEGQGFLRSGTRLWNYLPTAERTILIPPSMMLDRFMGSDFSNDDFVKMSYLPRDYEAQIAGQETVDGVDVYHLELTPKPDAPVTYGKLHILLGAADSMPVRMDFYNESLEKIRVLNYSEVKDFKGHLIPSVWQMTDLREKERVTTVTVTDAEFDQPIPDKVFNQANLEKYP